MASEEFIEARIVLVRKIPAYLTSECISRYIGSKIDKGKIERCLHLTDEDSDKDSNIWILLDSNEGVDGLVNEDHEIELENNTSFKFVCERVTSSSLPKEWHSETGDDIFLEHQSLKDCISGEDEERLLTADKTQYCLKIKGLPEAADQDYLTLYFDDDDLFVDCKILNVVLDESGTSATIYLDSQEDLEKMIEMGPFDMEDTLVSVEKCTTDESVSPACVPLCTIEVKGPPDSSIISERNISLLKMYFKNPRKSNGGKILDLTFESKKALVKFENEEVAKNVVEKERHHLSGHELTVSLYHPQSYEHDGQDQDMPFKIVLPNLPQSIDSGYLELYFDDEERFGEPLEIEEISFTEGHSTAVVEFKDKNAVKKIMKISPLEMDGQVIQAQIIQPSFECRPQQNVIEVHGPPDIVSDSNYKMLKKLFENKRISNGDEIIDSSISPGLASFTYKTEDVARRVAERKHTFKKCPLEVLLQKPKEVDESPSADQCINKIIVSRIPKGIDREYLEMFFENMDDNIVVKDLSLSDETRRAHIEFTNHDAVEYVMRKKSWKIKDTELSIEEWKPMKMRSISVKGPKNIEQMIDKLELYFKHRKSGGTSTIIDSWVEKETNTAFFTYEEEAVALNVVQKGDHSFENQKLEVKLCTERGNKEQPNEQDNMHDSFGRFTKVILRNVPKSVDEIYLRLFLEDQESTNLNVVNVKLQSTNRSAVVELDTPEAVECLCAKSILLIKEVEVSVERFIPTKTQSCTIAVSGIPNIEEHIESLEMYFKGRKSRGYSHISKHWIDQKANVAFFMYPCEEVAERVAAKTDHVIGQWSLHVSLCTENERMLERTNFIHVSKLPENMTEEYLKCFFEQLDMSFEFNVTRVTLNANQAFAIIEFDQHKAVDFILEQHCVKIKGNEIEIKPYTKSTLCSIEVTGIPDIEDQLETLYLYFKNTSKSNGGKIADYRADSHKAYFTFESADVTCRVLRKDHTHVWKGIKLSEVCEKTKEDREDGVSSSIVRVSGIEGVQRETLRYYFENSLASGGGKIVSFEEDLEDQNVIYVQFENSCDAECVDKRSHIVEGKTIKVRRYTPPPYNDKKILIKKLPTTTTKDGLFNFLEAKTGIRALQIAYSREDDDVVIVTMEKPPDFEKLTKVCQCHTLEGVNLKIGRVPVSNCIYLANVADEVSKDTVQFYFESKFGKAGKVDKVLMSKPEGTCLVFFEDYKVVDIIVKQEHCLSGKKLEVTCYQTLLKGPEEKGKERVFRVPDPIDLSRIDPEIITFCNKNSLYREKLADEMLKEYAHVIWPTKSTDIALIKCTLEISVSRCYKLSRTWKERVEEKINVFMKAMLNKRIDIHTDIWSNVMEQVRTISVERPDHIMILPDKQKYVIAIVGEKEIVDDVNIQILDIVSKLEQKLEKERQKVRESMRGFRPIEFRLLSSMNGAQMIKQEFDDLHIKIDDAEHIIIFEGCMSDVNEAKLKVFELKNRFGNKQVQSLSELMLLLYNSKEVFNFIQTLLGAKGLTALWEIKGSSLLICCTQEERIDECTDVILKSIVEEEIEFVADNVPIMRTENWKREKESLYRSYNGKVEIYSEVDEPRVFICATEDIHEAVLTDVEKFIDSNTILTKVLNLPRMVNRLIEKHHKGEITDLKSKLKEYYVDIVMLENYSGIKICGLSMGVHEASKQLQQLCNKVKERNHTVRKPGVAQHVRKPKGKDNINNVETLYKCIISIDAGDFGTSSVENKRVVAECTFLDDRKLVAMYVT